MIECHSCHSRGTIGGWLLLLWALLFQTAAGAEVPRPIDKWRSKGREFEKRGAWLEACHCYDQVLRKDRLNVAAREGYQRCLRRYQLATRHADVLHRQLVARLTPSQSLDAYEQVLSILTTAYPDRTRTNLTYLFKQGLLELRQALDEPLFRQHYLPGVKTAAINAYKNSLASLSVKRITTRTEAREQANAVIRSATRDGVLVRPLAASAFAFEFAAGACACLDEYSAFLTSGHLAVVQAALDGKLASIGVELGIVNERLEITRVYDKSPAYEAKLSKGERVVRIREPKKPGVLVEDLPAEAAADLLRGKPGSVVEVELERMSEAGPSKHTVKLVRRAIPITSVEKEMLLLEDDIPAGYLRIHHFQESTYVEVHEALQEMLTPRLGEPPIKGLILDLRGNPGGLFKSAVAIAELFLLDGVIVIGQSPFKEYNQPFKSESRGAFALPMVVLIDTDTASAAEVLAGALKEARASRFPTRIIGQPSYGKGTIQCIIPMEKAPLDKLAGIRLTVAKLMSPSNQPYTGRGVVPHVAFPPESDALLLARKHLLELINPAMPLMPPTPEMPPRPVAMVNPS